MSMPVLRYIPRIGYTWYIHGYTMYIHEVCTWYIQGYTWYILWCIYMVYTLYIHGHVYPLSILYMVYPRIYMVYALMYIHGIYTVYPWIFLDIPSFLKPDFAACLCCWSHSMRTRVWVIKSTTLFHAPPWQLCQGKRRPTKGSTRLLQTLNLPPSVDGGGGDGGGGSGVAGVFPFS